MIINSGIQRMADGAAAEALEHAQALSDEMAQMCQGLVQQPSVNGRDSESAVVAVIEDYAMHYAIPTDRFEAAPERPTLLLGPSAQSNVIAESGLLLVGHTDTVSEGNPDTWSYSPFGGQIVGDLLFGRGASDNKSGIVSAFFALVILDRMGLLTLINPVLLCVPDEESGALGHLGVQPLLQRRKLGARGAIYTYPGTKEIHIGHRGLLRLTVRAYGEAVHSGSRAWQESRRGVNAVTALADLLVELERLNIRLKTSTPSVWSDSLRTLVTPGTTIHGGSGSSTVPDECEATVDVRLIPGHDIDEVFKQIKEVADEVTRRRERENKGVILFEFVRDAHVPPTLTSPDSPIVHILQSVSATLLSGLSPLSIAGPANEGYLFNGAGVPTICGFGPEGYNAHAVDEYVNITSLPVVAAIYALVATELAAGA